MTNFEKPPEPKKEEKPKEEKIKITPEEVEPEIRITKEEVTPEEPKPEKVKEEEKKPEERFELTDLKEAKEKKYPWAETAEKTRGFLEKEVTNTNENLKQLVLEGVKEDSELHKKIQEAAYFRSEERQKKGEAGTPENDFLEAVNDFRKLYNTKLEILQERWDRLKTLSSREKGAKDEELNKRAYEIAEKAREKKKTISDIECNDKAREELLKNLGKEITDEEVREKIAAKEKEEKEKKEKQEKEKKETPKRELNEVWRKIEEMRVPQKGEAKEARAVREKTLEDLYKRAREKAQEITGENIRERVKEAAKAEVESEGLKVLTKKEFFSEERAARVQKRIRVERWGSSIREAWLRLSEQEKQKYKLSEEEKKIYGDNDIVKFMGELGRQRKSLEAKGVSLSPNVFYDLITKGYKPGDIKIKGIFKKEVVVPSANGREPIRIPMDKFKEWTGQNEKIIGELTKEEAQRELNRRFSEGHQRWERRKRRHLEQRINEIISPEGKAPEPKKEEKIKITPEDLKPKIKITKGETTSEKPEKEKEGAFKEEWMGKLHDEVVKNPDSPEYRVFITHYANATGDYAQAREMAAKITNERQREVSLSIIDDAEERWRRNTADAKKNKKWMEGTRQTGFADLIRSYARQTRDFEGARKLVEEKITLRWKNGLLSWIDALERDSLEKGASSQG